MLTHKNHRVIPVKFLFFLKSGLIFNIFFCFLYVSKQTFRKLYRYLTRQFLELRMRNFQGVNFMLTRTYREIFKSALVYL